MGIFNTLFGSTDEGKNERNVLPWIALNTLEQLNSIPAASHDTLQVIFKHSTRCGISSMVMKRFEAHYTNAVLVDLYYVDVLSDRTISDEAGYLFQVLHQSPQLIIIKNGETVHHSSHHSIDANVIATFL
jgi:bacillithiol system protein YtxJ